MQSASLEGCAGHGKDAETLCMKAEDTLSQKTCR